jgi:RimJ/RimL family protein N-acetyltransferase
MLRPFCDNDAPRLVEIANHADIAYNLASMPYPFGLQDAQEFLGEVKILPPQASCFAICQKENDGQLMGACGYGQARGRDKPAAEIDFGYWLGVDYWGRGYATEAARAVLAHAFHVSGIELIETDVLLTNPASFRILSRLGFECRGERTCHSRGSDETGTSMHMSLTRSRFLRALEPVA